MKILMLHPHDIYSTVEPWTVRIRELAKEYHRLGHNVKLIYFPLPKDERGKIEKNLDGVKTIAFSRRKWAMFTNIIKIMPYASWADVIHFQKCFANASLPALFGSLFFNRPIHYDWDDNEYAIYNSEPPSKIYGEHILFMEKLIPKLVDTVSYSSQSLKRLAMKIGVLEENLFEAHVGANLERFNPKISSKEIRSIYGENNHIVLYMGQLHGGQYAELFLKSIPHVKKKTEKVLFLIVGGGYKLDLLKEKAKKLGIEEDVIFTGAVEQKDVPNYLAAADVCVATFEDNKLTRAKSPLKIVEYMAMGKAIVASNIGEVPNMLGNSGYKAKPGDAKDIAKGIIMFLENKDKRKLSEKQARLQALEKYNWHVTAKNLLLAYKKAIIIHTKSNSSAYNRSFNNEHGLRSLDTKHASKSRNKRTKNIQKKSTRKKLRIKKRKNKRTLFYD